MARATKGKPPSSSAAAVTAAPSSAQTARSWLQLLDARHAPYFVRLDLAIVPNAHRTGLDGEHDGALRVRIHAPPVEGAANETLLRWLADGLGLRLKQLQLAAGATNRRKKVDVAAPAEAVLAWHARLTGQQSP
ncbi:MAG: hypothetical protein RL722_1068 [Pseudomonadota bacterium]|jgi:uncharacterized protein (TIGR00251 family)